MNIELRWLEHEVVYESPHEQHRDGRPVLLARKERVLQYRERVAENPPEGWDAYWSDWRDVPVEVEK